MFILLAPNGPKGQPFTCSRVAGLPEVDTPLRGAARRRAMAILKKLLYFVGMLTELLLQK